MLGLLTGLGLLGLWHLIYKAFDGVWHAGLLHKLQFYGISGQIFGLISSFLSNRWLRVVLDGKSSRDNPVNAGVPHASFLGPTFFLLYISDLPDDVICNIVIYADDTTPYSKCDQGSDLWQQLELPSEIESDLGYTVDWGKKWLVDFNAGKTQLVSFDRSNSGSIDAKMDGFVLEEKSSFKMLYLTFSSKLDWGSDIISIAKTASKKIGVLIRSLDFRTPDVAIYLYKSTNLHHLWNTVVTSGQVPLVATWNCYTSYKSEYVGLLVLHLLFLLDPWLIVEKWPV